MKTVNTWCDQESRDEKLKGGDRSRSHTQVIHKHWALLPIGHNTSPDWKNPQADNCNCTRNRFEAFTDCHGSQPVQTSFTFLPRRTRIRRVPIRLNGYEHKKLKTKDEKSKTWKSSTPQQTTGEQINHNIQPFAETCFLVPFPCQVTVWNIFK